MRVLGAALACALLLAPPAFAGTTGVESGASRASADILYAAQAKRGSLVPEGDGRYALTLRGVAPEVVGFSDRPYRDTFNITRRGFFENVWQTTFNDPPAVALDFVAGGRRHDTVILEVENPQLFGSSIKLDARVVKRSTTDLGHFPGRIDPTPPHKFGATSVFFDTQPKPTPAHLTAPPAKRRGVDLVFATGARSGHLKPRGHGRYGVTLHGIRDDVAAFSDHPAHLSYNISSKRFFGTFWNSVFSDSDPNGALDLLAPGASSKDSIALRLTNPRLHGSTVRFDGRRLNRTPHELQRTNRNKRKPPRRFGHASLFVDATIGNPPDTSDCRFYVHGRSQMSFNYVHESHEGSYFKWHQPSGYGQPFAGVPGGQFKPANNGGGLERSSVVKWLAQATAPTFGSISRCQGIVTLQAASPTFSQPQFVLRVTDYMLGRDRKTPAAECSPLTGYVRCERSIDTDYSNDCYYTTGGQTDDSYCVQTWLSVGTFLLCNIPISYPAVNTCPGYKPPVIPDSPL